jgi:hypothetical protein
VHRILWLAALSACTDGGDTTNDTDPTDAVEEGSFHAVIDGEDWDADADKIAAVVGDFGGGPVLSLNATQGATKEFFTIQLDAFEGTFTTTDFTGIVVRFNSPTGVFQITDDGSMTIEQSGDGISEVYTGVFEGTFPHLIEDRSVVITGGTFEVHRLL